MPAMLHVKPASASRFDLRIGNTASIGRLPDSAVCLSSDDLVSREHAVIRSYNGCDYQIIDLGSLNGTYVNGQRVVLPARLENGARIAIAKSEIIFRLIGEPLDEYPKTISFAQDEAGSGSASIFVALMVCDIRGFTRASETLSASDLAQTLGGWFRKAGNLVQDSDGQIDKFIGDAFFAYWKDVETAFAVGRELLKHAPAIQWPVLKTPLEVTVALHCGKVTRSNVGMMVERDATIMGDAVNTVFRLEPIGKELGQSLLVSEEFLVSLGSTDGFTDLGERTLKGKRYPVRVFGYNAKLNRP